MSISKIMTRIDKMGWCCIRDGRVLVARSQGKEVFYIPGGKREMGESDQDALIREIKEELSVEIKPETIQYFDTFESQAHGKQEGHSVKTTCYFADFFGEVKASSEIEEIAWITYDERDRCSAVTQMIIDALKEKGKL